VGAVIGVGLTKGFQAVSGKKISMIIAGWALSPLLAALFAFLAYKGILSLLN
jgi:phosphate/sulfate permease